MYGHAYSSQTISNLTKSVQENVDTFHNRPISTRYFALFCDATMLNIRRDSILKDALYIIIGITADGNKEVLDYRLYPQEGA